MRYNMSMSVKVISLNIWRAEVLENLISFIKQENPDILLFQEVYDGKSKDLPPAYRFFQYFQEVFPQYNGVFAAAFMDITEYGNIEEGTAVFSKFKITRSKRTFFDIPYFTFNGHARERFDDIPQTLLHAQLDAHGIELNAFSMHGIWGTDGLDTPRRLQMAETVIKEVEGKENVILAGDFNLNPDTDAVKKIEKHLQSVFGVSLIKTFNMKHKTDPGYAVAAVDMMFVNRNIKVIEKDCPDVDVSDHLPLIATLEI